MIEGENLGGFQALVIFLTCMDESLIFLLSLSLSLFEQDYVAIKDRSAVYVPHTAGRYSARRFRKAQVSFADNLILSFQSHEKWILFSYSSEWIPFFNW